MAARKKGPKRMGIVAIRLFAFEDVVGGAYQHS